MLYKILKWCELNSYRKTYINMNQRPGRLQQKHFEIRRVVKH